MAGEEIQQIKDRINIADIVGQYVTLRRAGRTFVGKCPFHKERTPSFHVSPERGTYKCFGCGEGGDIFTFVEKMDGIDFATALKQLAERAGVKLDPRRYKPKAPQEKEKEERLFEVCEAAAKYFEEQLHTRSEVKAYLRERGLKDETIASWRLGYAPASWESLSKHLLSLGFGAQDIVEAGFALKSEKRQGEIFDRFRGRIIFPIFDQAGRPVAVSGRFFEKVPGQKEDGEPAKYVNSPETPLFKKSRVLYGFDRAKAHVRELKCFLLVEGQFDVVMSHQAGYPIAVALSGTALTPEHLSLLGRLSKNLVLALDNDEAGLKAGLRSAGMAIAEGFDVKIPAFPPGADPADLAKQNPELLKAAIRTSKPAVEFFLDALRTSAKDGGAYAKRVQAEVLPLIASMHSRIEAERAIAAVASRLNVPEGAVREDVARVHLPKPVGKEAPSPELHALGAESVLTALEKKAGMLLAYFGESSDISRKLEELWGRDELHKLASAVVPHAEELKLRFEAQVHEGTSEQEIASDMLADIGRHLARERVKMKFM